MYSITCSVSLTSYKYHVCLQQSVLKLRGKLYVGIFLK